jgi:hypothetical protein
MLAHLHIHGVPGRQLAGAQQLLFPSNPRSVCDEIGLNWWAALKLYEDGWLSFSPETTNRLDEAQEAELRFVGSLVLAGCDRPMLANLLRNLARPYAYLPGQIYYEWSTRQWKPLPDPKANPEAAFMEWLDSLVQSGDVSSLSGILELATDALSRLRIHPAQQEFRKQA